MGKKGIVFIIVCVIVFASLAGYARGATFLQIPEAVPTNFPSFDLGHAENNETIEISMPSLPKLEKEASRSLDYIEGYIETESRV